MYRGQLYYSLYQHMNLNWKKIKQQGLDAPGNSRNGLSLTYLSHLNSLLPFGGPLKTNIIYLFSLDNLQWSSQSTEGRRPTSRCYHASYYDQNEQVLYIHGGQAEPGRSLEDFHILFVKNWTWKKLFFREKQLPVGRHGHTMVGYQDYKIIHGGVYSSENKLLDDTWIMKGTYKYTSASELHGSNFQRLNTKGIAPSPRKHHQAFVFNDEMFIVGGDTGDKRPSLSIFSLSFSTLNWKQIEVPKDFKQRSNFSLMVNRNQAIIFGGKQCHSNSLLNDVLIFDPQRGKVSKIEIEQSPSARCSHCMAASVSGPFRSWMLGGTDKSPTLQIYELYDESKIQTRPQITALNYEEYVQHLSNEIAAQKEEEVKLAKILQKSLSPQSASQTQNSNMIEHLLLLIKSEQFLSQELQKKDSTLQHLLKSIQQYISVLNSNYKNYGQESMQIQRVRENHIYICLKLKETYKNIERLTRRNLSRIQQYRSDVVSMNREFQGFMETEIDEEI